MNRYPLWKYLTIAFVLVAREAAADEGWNVPLVLGISIAVMVAGVSGAQTTR